MIRWHLQSFRFVLVGLTSNFILFMFYLLLTSFGIGPRIAMSGLFAFGVIQTFMINKQWTFMHQGAKQASFLKYLCIYSFAYLINMIAFLIFVDELSYPHQVVQGVMVFSLALVLFLLQKFWVFR